MAVPRGAKSIGFATVLSVAAVQAVGGATWDAGGLDPNWSTPENWIGDLAPPNDGSADIVFNDDPPATPLVLSPWSFRSLNLTEDAWQFVLAGDRITIGSGGFNSSPYAFFNSTSALIWNDITLSADQAWQQTMKHVEVVGNISADGHHLSIHNLGDFTFSGNAVFDGGLDKNGEGYLYFDNTPAITGGVSIRAGVMSIPAPIAGGTHVDGGAIEMRGDWDITSLVAPGSTGGDLLWRGQNAINFGGTNHLDFSSLGLTGVLRLGATEDSTISSDAILLPDTASKTIYLGAGDATLTVNSIIADTLAGPTELNISGDATTVLNTANTFTGESIISGGIVEANTPTAFGTTSASTRITGGEARINTATDEPFIVEGGTLDAGQDIGSSINLSGGNVFLYDAQPNHVFNNTVTMSGGILNYNVYSNNIGTVSGPITLLGGGRSAIRSHVANTQIVLDGPIQGDGTLVLDSIYAQIHVQTALAHTGDTVIYSDSWLNPSYGRGIYFNSAQAFGGNLVMEGGILFNDAPNAVPNLIMKDGRVAGSAPLTVTNPVLNIQAGEIDIPGGLVGIQHIVKTGMDEGKLLDLGAHISPTVEVQAGRLGIATNAANAINGPVQIREGAMADILVMGNSPVMVDVQLNNGMGVSYSGALSADETGLLTGVVDLGTAGAYVGGRIWSHTHDDFYLNISGRITGGDLTKVNRSTLILSGSNNNYTGETKIINGMLNITGGGQISTTQSIHVIGHGTLRLDHGLLAINQDHIGDSIPIHMDSGVIQLISSTDMEIFDETLGPLSVDGGGAVIFSEQERHDKVAPQSVVFDSLTRHRSATLSFESGHIRVGTPGGYNYRFNNAPALTNDIIGSWAIMVNTPFNEVDFVTYDPVLGVGMLSKTGRPSDINTATGSDNVLLATNATLTDDRTVYTLHTSQSTVNLGGHTLTVQGGGILMGDRFYAPEFSNGQLTTGAELSELILHVGRTNGAGSGIIRADIIDSASGPTDLVVSRYQTETRTYVELLGHNTYTGTTFLNQGAGVHILETHAVPLDNDVVLNGGTYNVRIGSGQVTLGDITLRSGGSLVSQRYNGIQANQIQAESGSIYADLFGDMPIVKTTTGLLTIGYANAETQDQTNTNYTGDIDIRNGIVVVEPLYGLGGGQVTVQEGGRLVMNRRYNADDSIVHGHIVMAGGQFAVGIREDAILEGSFDVTADSTVLTFYGLAERDYYHSYGSVNDHYAARHITLAGDTTVAEETTLTALGAGTLTITGDLMMQSGAELTGDVIVQPVPGRRIMGDGTIVGKLIIGDAAALMPGTSAGLISVEGDYTQMPGGLLEIELTGDLGAKGTDYDHLMVTGSAQLAGELSVLLTNGFTPSAQDVFTIINAGSMTGDFDQYNLPDLGSNLAWGVVFTESGLVLEVVSTLIGDLDGDGFVGINDLNTVLVAWNQHVTPGDLSSGDVTGDGYVGIGDLTTVLGNWNTGSPPANAHSNIPEPTSLMVLIVGAYTCCLIKPLQNRALP